MFAVERVLWGVEELTQKATEVIVSVGGYLGRIMGIIRKENKKKKTRKSYAKSEYYKEYTTGGARNVPGPTHLAKSVFK